MINWFCGSLPSQVASFGKREFFVKENQYIGDKYGEDRFLTWRDPHRNTTPFAGDNDLQDNQICIARFRNNILVSFCATMCNIIPERRMLFHCTEGNLILELYSSSIKYRNLADEKETEIKFSADGHGGGDNTIMKELYECMCEGSTPKLSLVLITGGAVNLSDNMLLLDEHGLDLARKTVSAESGYACRPLDMFEHELPVYWTQKLKKGGRALVINWTDRTQELLLDWKKLAPGVSELRNFWNGKIEKCSDRIALTPHSCKLWEF